MHHQRSKPIPEVSRSENLTTRFASCLATVSKSEVNKRRCPAFREAGGGGIYYHEHEEFMECEALKEVATSLSTRDYLLKNLSLRVDILFVILIYNVSHWLSDFVAQW